MEDSLLMIFALAGCSIFMLVIGISNIFSRKSVGFYSGEKGPVFETMKEEKAWNRKHGFMWITYGLIIAGTSVSGIFIENWAVKCAVILAGLLIPPAPMIKLHNSLKKKAVGKK